MTVLAIPPRRLFGEWLLTGLGATALALLLILTSAAARLDNVLYDAVMRLSVRPTPANIIIVAIDDRSIDELGPWPWPRSVHARLIEQLAAARPRSIAYDILFLDPQAPEQDEALARAVAGAGNVCLPVLIEQPGPNGDDTLVRGPIAPLSRAAAGLGHVTLRHDSDGVIRRADLVIGGRSARTPHLMACAHQVGSGATVRDLAETVLIPFRGGDGHIRTVSAASVVRGEVPAPFLRNAYVLVGATASGLHDRHATPLTDRGGAMSGVEVQANLLAALLSGEGVRQAGPALQAFVALTVIWLLMASLLFLPPRRSLPVGLALLAAATALSVLLLRAAQVWLPPAALFVVVLFVLPLWGWRRLQAASRYMLEELEAFEREPDLLPSAAVIRPTDSVERQIELMGHALARVRDLRRFTTDALSSLPDPTLVVAQDGEVLFANPAARRLAPGGERELAALSRGWTTLTGEDVAPPRADQVERSWQTEVVSPDGRAFLVAVAPYRDSNGRLAASIVRLTDITELKAAAAQREQIVQLLTHDMRSPQSSILAVLETAGAGEVRADLAERLAGYARRTLMLADNIVQLARAGSDALQLEVLDLADVLADAVDDLWPQARRAGVKLENPAAEAEHLIVGERSLLTRAAVNLVDNAIKYSPNGGVVRCSVRTEDGPSGLRAVLEVSDQGPGLSPGQREKLFTPFRRFAAPDRKGSPGVGLGLALVRQVVRRHDGEIDCRSGPGGATFTLAFPTADQVAG